MSAPSLLADLAVDDGDDAGRAVVVVEAGVVTGHPADEPGRRVRAGGQLAEDALRRVVADVRAPQLRLRGEVLGEDRELVDREVALIVSQS
jgi:hypothetical protein